MRKSEMVRLIAESLGMKLNRAEGVYDVIVESMISALARGRRVKLRGFGSFIVVRRRTKVGHNPLNGDRLVIPEHGTVRFQPGRHLLRDIERVSEPEREAVLQD